MKGYIRAVTRTMCAAALIWAANPASAAPETPKAGIDKAAVDDVIAVEKRFSAIIGGRRIAYTVKAEEIFVEDDAGRPKASIFSTSYIATDPGKRDRPVIFAFNGGPGSSSFLLHMGYLGPRAANYAAGVNAGPASLVDNPMSPLDVADIVLIDPMGTGYSRPLNGHEAREFYGIGEDAAVLADFVRAWLTRHRRWGSPKYLLGESYGGVRAAAMARALSQEERGPVALSGLILLAPGLDFQSVRQAPQYPLVSFGYLPTLAAISWYHGLIPKEEPLEQLVARARRFAQDEYLPALVKGQLLDPRGKQEIATRLQQFTGLDAKYFLDRDLYVDPSQYLKDLMRDRRRTISRMDGRYLGEDFDVGGMFTEYDAGQVALAGILLEAMQSLLAHDLGLGAARPYIMLNRSGVKPNWNWKLPDATRWSGMMNPEWPVHVNVAPYIGDEMRRNRNFKVYIGLGYFDMSIPFFSVENSMIQTGMVLSSSKISHFPTGHLIYADPEAGRRLASEVRSFITGGIPQ